MVQARGFASEALQQWDLVDLAADVQLVLSELVTNAVLHARTPIDITLRRTDEGLRIEVADGSTAGVVPHALLSAAPTTGLLAADADFEVVEELLNVESTTGRGLQLVESLSLAWGRGPRDGAEGKVVWAVIGRRPQTRLDRESSAAAGPVEEPPEVGHPVHLIAIPVWLGLASEVNLDAMVREFQMVEAAGAPADHPTELIAIVRDFLERFATGRRAGQMALRAALERGDRLFDIELVVGDGAGRELRRFGRAMDQISAYCERGELLVLAPTEEVRQFREWYGDEVTRQLGGEEPRACPFTTLAISADHGAADVLVADGRAALRQMLADLAAAVDVDAAVELFLGCTVEAFGAGQASLFTLRPGTRRLEMIGQVGMPGAVVEHWSSFGLDDDVPASEALRAGQPVMIRTLSEREQRYPIFIDTPTVEDVAVACVPLIGRAGDPYGVLSISFPTSLDLGPTQMQLLVELCSWMTRTLERLTSPGADPAT
ncbi:MAG TPA: ATP-binding protein [Acidimicrobiales bacterium]|nr:ATP-binding protein [Acidimicrobiales bacterium]